MAINNNLSKSFLLGVEEIKIILTQDGFNLYSFKEKGLAYYVEFKKNDIIVQFLFGPADWTVEMIVFLHKRKYNFRDLLQFTIIAKWVNNNRYKQNHERNITDELIWFVELLKISLPILESSIN